MLCLFSPLLKSFCIERKTNLNHLPSYSRVAEQIGAVMLL